MVATKTPLNISGSGGLLSAPHAAICRFSLLHVLSWSLVISLAVGAVYFMLPEDADLVIAALDHPPMLSGWLPPPPRTVVSLATVGGRVEYLHKSLPSLLNQVRTQATVYQGLRDPHVIKMSS